jgi:hypothetical protein
MKSTQPKAISVFARLKDFIVAPFQDTPGRVAAVEDDHMSPRLIEPGPRDKPARRVSSAAHRWPPREA